MSVGALRDMKKSVLAGGKFSCTPARWVVPAFFEILWSGFLLALRENHFRSFFTNLAIGRGTIRSSIVSVMDVHDQLLGDESFMALFALNWETKHFDCLAKDQLLTVKITESNSVFEPDSPAPAPSQKCWLTTSLTNVEKLAICSRTVSSSFPDEQDYLWKVLVVVCSSDMVLSAILSNAFLPASLGIGAVASCNEGSNDQYWAGTFFQGVSVPDATAMWRTSNSIHSGFLTAVASSSCLRRSESTMQTFTS